MSTGLTLYDYLPSGNGYKVRLVLKQLGIPYRLVQVDIKQGLTRTPEFLAKNPNGRIPLLEIEGQGFLSESHAIIWYLAEGSRLVPAERLQRAQMWQWLSFEQYNLEPNVGTVRFWLSSLHKTPEELGEKLKEKVEKGYQALEVLEKGLTGRDFLVGGQYSLADIGLYAYTHVAEEGDFSLARFAAIRAWLARVADQPRYEPITAP
ncbi:MAG TPA: glutathione S-transferase family protein [Steroidobacteraceae bacterium]|nr:glutathione S-transferase family protein [Steroidobacteraceae bacterium]